MIDDFYRQLYSTLKSSRGDAYVRGQIRISYAEFLRTARRINTALSGKKRAPIVTLGTKSPETYAAILAIILSGNTWVPLSRSAPPLRNCGIIDDLCPALIFSDEDLPEPIAEAAMRVGATIEDLAILAGTDAETEFNQIEYDANDLAMIYFTSGSTGEPKGVPITHGNYIPVIENLLKILPLHSTDIFADYYDFSFVISIPVLFTCWMVGGAIAPALSAAEVFLPTENLADDGVTVLITVPSTVARIKRKFPDGVPGTSLRILINCGEPLHLDILSYSLNLVGSGDAYNFYGSTEVAPWTFFHHCKPGDEERFAQFGYAPIGKLLPGNEMRIDESTGELFVAGAQITPGYLHARDSHRFIVSGGERWYATGDKVVAFDEVYICKGRLDAQVKIAGHRVELMDTEAHLCTLEGVEGAVCFTEGGDESKIIVAALHASRPVSLTDVRAHLRERLPAYMIPRKIHVLAEVPTNKNGKLDRLAIRETYGAGLRKKGP